MKTWKELKEGLKYSFIIEKAAYLAATGRELETTLRTTSAESFDFDEAEVDETDDIVEQLAAYCRDTINP